MEWMTVGTYLGVGTEYSLDVATAESGHYALRLRVECGPVVHNIVTYEHVPSTQLIAKQRELAQRMIDSALAELEAEME